MRAHREHILSCVLGCRAGEELCQRLVLPVEVGQHYAQLLPVFGHVVGLSAVKVVLAVAYVVDVLCGQLGHLGRASCGEHFFAEILPRVYRCRFGRRGKRDRRLWLAGRSVDGQQRAVGQRNVACRCLGVELHGVALCLVGLAIGAHGHANELVCCRSLGLYIVQAQVSLGIPAEVSRRVSGLFHPDNEAQHGLWEEVYSALRGHPRPVVACLGLGERSAANGEQPCYE